MKMTGIIFSEMYNDELNAFTHDRNMAAIPFGGRYRLIDFTLSNMVNSGITNVGVLAKQHYHSLLDHLANTQEWDLNRKNGGLLLLPPFATENFNQIHRGKLDELRNALDYLQDAATPYVLLASAHTLCNMDYRPALESHINSGCDITVVATKEAGGDAPFAFVLLADDTNRATACALDYPASAGSYAATGTYIISRELLIHVIQEYTAQGAYDLERDFIQRKFNQGQLSINVYECQDVVLRIRNVAEYFAANMSLTDIKVRRSLFRSDSPIYTKVNDEVPTYYGMDCSVSGCIIADGCIIEGNAENSVLSRGVRIGKGAVVKDCIIMQGSVVGEGAKLENVIVDKWATISSGAELKGLASAPVIIRKGVTV